MEEKEEKEEDLKVVKSEAAMLHRTRQYDKSIKRYTKVGLSIQVL